MPQQVAEDAAAEASLKLPRLAPPAGMRSTAQQQQQQQQQTHRLLRQLHDKHVTAWLTRELQALLLSEAVSLPFQVQPELPACYGLLWPAMTFFRCGVKLLVRVMCELCASYTPERSCAASVSVSKA
jgi:hypothetical protein